MANKHSLTLVNVGLLGACLLVIGFISIVPELPAGELPQPPCIDPYHTGHCAEPSITRLDHGDRLECWGSFFNGGAGRSCEGFAIYDFGYGDRLFGHMKQCRWHGATTTRFATGGTLECYSTASNGNCENSKGLRTMQNGATELVIFKSGVETLASNSLPLSSEAPSAGAVGTSDILECEEKSKGGVCNGVAHLTRLDGSSRTGQIKNGVWVGEVVEILASGIRIDCTIGSKGNCNGEGRQFNPNGTWVFVTWADGQVISTRNPVTTVTNVGPATNAPFSADSGSGIASQSDSDAQAAAAQQAAQQTSDEAKQERAEEQAQQQAQAAAQHHDFALQHCRTEQQICEQNCSNTATFAGIAAEASVYGASRGKGWNSSNIQAMQQQREQAQQQATENCVSSQCSNTYGNCMVEQGEQ